MKKLISFSLILVFVLGNMSLAEDMSAVALRSFNEGGAKAEYRLGSYDTIEMEIVNHPELKTKQTITPDGQASLPILGVVEVEGQTLKSFQQYLSDSYSDYIDNPQLVINLTPKPIYVVQYDLKKDVWEVKAARSVDEARAYAGLDPTLTFEHGNVYRVTMSQKPDFWEENWYKMLTGVAVAVGIYATVHK